MAKLLLILLLSSGKYSNAAKYPHKAEENIRKLPWIYQFVTDLCEPVERHVLDAVEVDEGGGDDEDVEDLVALEPEVALARQEPLRHPARVQASAWGTLKIL